MIKNWEPTPLGDLLTRSDKVININPLETYKQVTVRLWGNGVILRDEVSGSEISAAKRYEVKPGQFILSKIDARNGAFGLVSPALDKAVVSGDFPVFDINLDRLEPKYLEWKSKTGEFVDLCRVASEGTTNRVRLKEDKFLRLSISLPLLPEQRRIVAKIDELASKIEEAYKLRSKVNIKVDMLSRGSLKKLIENLGSKYGFTKISEVTNSANGFGFPKQFQGRTDLPYLFIKVSDMNLSGNEKYLGRANNTVDSNLLRSIRARVYPKGTLIFPKIGGAIATNKRRILLVESSFDNNIMGLIPSSDLDPDWLYYFMLSIDLTDLQAGTSVPAIKQAKVENLEIPFLPRDEQRRIVAYLDGLQAKVEALKKLQAQTAAELDALLPAILDRAFKGEL